MSVLPDPSPECICPSCRVRFGPAPSPADGVAVVAAVVLPLLVVVGIVAAFVL